MSTMIITPDPAAAWRQRLAEVRAAADRAENALGAAVRDAVRAGQSPSVVATTLDLDLVDVEEMLQEPSVDDDPAGGGDDAEQPPLPPVVFLRGREVPNQTWKLLKQRLWARGLATVANRTAAAQLARGGIPVVFVDFSSRTADNLKVAGVRGVYRDDVLTLEVINGGDVKTPRLPDESIDVDQIMLLVHQVIGDLPAVNMRRMLAPQRTAERTARAQRS